MKKLSFLAAGIIAVLFSVSAAEAKDVRDVVRTENGIVVVNTFENCVRTSWESDADGCKGRIKLTERTIYFDFGSAALTQDSLRKLNKLATRLKNADDVISLKVIGYADKIGSASSNNALSARRAKAVESYLRSRVKNSFSRREVRGLGESNSRTSCSDSLSRADKIECLAEDRRVEVEATYKR